MPENTPINICCSEMPFWGNQDRRTALTFSRKTNIGVTQHSRFKIYVCASEHNLHQCCLIKLMVTNTANIWMNLFPGSNFGNVGRRTVPALIPIWIILKSGRLSECASWPTGCVQAETDSVMFRSKDAHITFRTTVRRFEARLCQVPLIHNRSLTNAFDFVQLWAESFVIFKGNLNWKYWKIIHTRTLSHSQHIYSWLYFKYTTACGP